MQARYYLDYDTLTAGRSITLHLMLHLQASESPAATHRRPLNLGLVIDRSGSMAGQKIAYTRQAAQFMVQNLSAQDTLSIVLYSDTVETLLLPEKVQRKDIINQRIAQIKPGGTTNLSGGWLEGCQLVARNLADDQLNRVILMSDGLANRGVIDPQQLLGLAQQKLGEGVSTTTMGLGRDFNEDLLMQMADAGGGAFYFIESPEVTPAIFQEELRGLLNVVGQNLVTEVALTERASGIRQMNDYPQQHSGDKIAFRMGDVFGEEIKALLLEIDVPPVHELGTHRVATLRVEYDELHPNGVAHQVIELPVDVTIVAEDAHRLPHPEVKQSVLLLQAAQARREAVKAADSGHYMSASQILRTAADAIQKAQIDHPRLVDELDALVKQATDIERGADAYSEYERKSMATQAFYTMHGRHEDTVMLRNREDARSGSKTEETNAAPPQTEIKVERVDGVTPTHVTWKDQTFALSGELIRIGRAKHNEIVIAATGVSRFHCHIRRDGDGDLILEDLSSKNGTRIGSKTLNGPHALTAGDVVYVCDEKLTFHVNATPEGNPNA